MIMLKATNSPTVSSPLIAAVAPKYRTSAIVALFTYWIMFLPGGRQHYRLERRFDIGGQPLLPLGSQDRLDRRGLDRVGADHRLDKELVAGGPSVQSLLDLFTQWGPQKNCDNHI